MTGRKSKRGQLAYWLACALLGAFALVPATAIAAPGDNEYGLDIPTGNGDGQDPTANASGGSGGATGTDASATDTDGSTTPTGTDETTDGTDDSDAGGAAGGKGDGNGGGRGNDEVISGTAGDRHQKSLAPTGEASGVTPNSDDGGGFPVILIAIAALAAAGVGFAAWRLRKGDGDGVGRPAESGHGV